MVRYFGIKSTLHYIKEKKRNHPLGKQGMKIDLHERVVVYTAIFGQFDDLKEPLYINKNIDYIVITDAEIPADSIWKKYSNEKVFSLIDNYNDQMKNRFCKIFPNLFFEDYKYSIYIDGNIQIVKDISSWIGVLSEKNIGMFSHPYRDDIYLEAMAVIKLNNAAANKVIKQIDYYKAVGFPENYGLFENSIIVRRHLCKDVIEIMTEWWNQINLFTSRDQLSFMFVIWRLGLDKEYIADLGPCINECGLVVRQGHNKLKRTRR